MSDERQKGGTVTPRILSNGTGYSITPSTEDELVSGLDEIDRAACARNEPLIAMLVADTGEEDPPALSIGLGAEESLLVYSAGDWSGEGGFSKGTRAGDTSVVHFRYGSAVNEYLGWMLITKQVAYEAAKEFFRTGQQPTNVEWGNP